MRVKELNQERLLDAPKTSLDNLSKIMNDCSRIKTAPHLFQSHTIDIKQARIEAQGKWVSSISALETLLLSYLETTVVSKENYQGLILSAPTPILCHPALIKILHTGIFTLQTNTLNLWKQFKLPADINCSNQIHHNISRVMELPILPQDPLASEQFCLILTSHFSLMIVLGENSLGFPTFQFTFNPEINYRGWLRLRFGLNTLSYSQLFELDQLVQRFMPIFPRYQIIEEFSRLLLHNFTSVSTIIYKKNSYNKDSDVVSENNHLPKDISLNVANVEKANDLDLLRALSHEVLTPLTSIRTMTRLLLKYQDLEPKITQLLENIDQECSEQINRMELIFRATELKSKKYQNSSVELVKTSLESLLNRCIPRWKKQAQRRNIDLDIGLPKTLPQVVSDPQMLDKVLTSLIEKCTRSLSGQGLIRIQVSTAGHQLKLQFQTESYGRHNPLESLGQVLMLQPETGSVSLNLDVTKNLFHRLGGKLIIRQRSRREETFTIFFPLT
ncbi:sensor histidine kinase [Candidatus Atelocyanobacterium thalassae]|uniref:histidine kinase n=1 Tax=Atelocyanobacterium thalassa (isolate ALOHA) TaxID=1453429 RepID=D3ENZ9_ATETH|nr:HAMP domain-containing sensor histidine kinase [Candidatus Atelocyanobacterium thalassa]ADB95199.1 histidine kinase [Candidatus Atelocyanobacterium thalassa isolate ALOHA]MCH2543205.1 HAMP domain-containing histidine kinase [Candidatus Atelocyanobacterium sp. ALOHA_A2.5_9]|tara:strand:+ start:1287 stop:2789 length:1503 start_codon:yes stop_codon:yes gene_type:complete